MLKVNVFMISEKQESDLLKSFCLHPNHRDRKTVSVIFEMLISMYAPKGMSDKQRDSFVESVVYTFVRQYKPKYTPIGTLIRVIKNTPEPEKEEKEHYNFTVLYDTIEE